MTETRGRLYGRYRARYRITDQAISPNVAFEFEGTPRMPSATLPWSGSGGSRGEITLTLRDNGTLEVTWVAKRLGKELGLISGSATLVRKLE
jgi:hypothetical protein